MNGNRASIDEICGWLAAGPLDPAVEVVVGVPGCYLHYVSQKLAATQVSVAAQNCYKAANGAFTGELSPGMIQDCGAGWVILGHSERRNVFGEADQMVGEKAGFALQAGLSVIPCIGEKLEEREADQTTEVGNLLSIYTTAAAPRSCSGSCPPSNPISLTGPAWCWPTSRSGQSGRGRRRPRLRHKRCTRQSGAGWRSRSARKWPTPPGFFTAAPSLPPTVGNSHNARILMALLLGAPA